MEETLPSVVPSTSATMDDSKLLTYSMQFAWLLSFLQPFCMDFHVSAKPGLDKHPFRIILFYEMFMLQCQ